MADRTRTHRTIQPPDPSFDDFGPEDDRDFWRSDAWLEPARPPRRRGAPGRSSPHPRWRRRRPGRRARAGRARRRRPVGRRVRTTRRWSPLGRPSGASTTVRRTRACRSRRRRRSIRACSKPKRPTATMAMAHPLLARRDVRTPSSTRSTMTTPTRSRRRSAPARTRSSSATRGGGSARRPAPVTRTGSRRTTPRRTRSSTKVTSCASRLVPAPQHRRRPIQPLHPRRRRRPSQLSRSPRPPP